MTIFQMANGWTDHSAESPCLEHYAKAGYTVFKAVGDTYVRVTDRKGKEVCRCMNTEIAMAVVDNLVVVDELASLKKVKANTRFVANRTKLAGGKVERHYVTDTVMQIEAFHWYGPTGKDKCEAVAAALNALGHRKD